MPLVAHPVRSLWGSQPRCARCVCEWLHRKWDGAQEILYDRPCSSRTAKRVKFDTVSVADLPELVPDLPQAVVACEPEVLQDSGEVMLEPFYFPL